MTPSVVTRKAVTILSLVFTETLLSETTLSRTIILHYLSHIHIWYNLLTIDLNCIPVVVYYNLQHKQRLMWGNPTYLVNEWLSNAEYCAEG